MKANSQQVYKASASAFFRPLAFSFYPLFSTSMPYEYLIDHIKVWQLINACDSTLTIADIDPLDYDYTVKQSINLGNGGGTLSNGEGLILRANQSITLEAGYEAVLGSELTLVISDCMEDGGVFPSSNPGGLKNAPENVTPIPYPKPYFFPINY